MLKKLLLVAMLTSCFAEPKIAFVDISKVVKSLPEYSKMEGEMQKEAAIATKKFNSKKSQLEAKVEQLENNDARSEQMVMKLKREISTLQRELKFLESSLNEELSLREQEHKSTMITKAMNIISDYAKNRSIDAIFPTDQALYQSGGQDITDDLLKTIKS